ncbi:MAG: hypothetical protein ABFS02_06490, partial [Pseudomonadota bacterium]
MKRRAFITRIGTGSLAAGTALSVPSVASGKAKIRWKMVTAWPKNFPGLGTNANLLAGIINEMSGGRIHHHLKNNIWKPSSHLVIVGFQAYGTPGRRLVDGADEIRRSGDTCRVRARLHTI